MPPMLSCASRNLVISASMRAAILASGHRVGACKSTVSRLIESSNLMNSGFCDWCGYAAVGGKRNSEPTEDVNATIRRRKESRGSSRLPRPPRLVQLSLLR